MLSRTKSRPYCPKAPLRRLERSIYEQARDVARALAKTEGDAGLSDLKAKLEQLAMDTRRAPQRIVHADPPDQRPQVCVDLRPAS